jgi:hypothetical protein
MLGFSLEEEAEAEAEADNSEEARIARMRREMLAGKATVAFATSLLDSHSARKKPAGGAGEGRKHSMDDPARRKALEQAATLIQCRYRGLAARQACARIQDKLIRQVGTIREHNAKIWRTVWLEITAVLLTHSMMFVLTQFFILALSCSLNDNNGDIYLQQAAFLYLLSPALEGGALFFCGLADDALDALWRGDHREGQAYSTIHRDRLRKRVALGFALQLVICQKMEFLIKRQFDFDDFVWVQGLFMAQRLVKGAVQVAPRYYYTLRGEEHTSWYKYVGRHIMEKSFQTHKEVLAMSLFSQHILGMVATLMLMILSVLVYYNVNGKYLSTM